MKILYSSKIPQQRSKHFLAAFCTVLVPNICYAAAPGEISYYHSDPNSFRIESIRPKNSRTLPEITFGRMAETNADNPNSFSGFHSDPSELPSGDVVGPKGPVEDAAATSSTEPETRYQRRYRKVQKSAHTMMIAFQIINVLDTVETISCVHKTTCKEGNPILGSRPSTGTIVGFKAGAALFNYAVYRLLHKDPMAQLGWEIGQTAAYGVIAGLNFRHAF